MQFYLYAGALIRALSNILMAFTDSNTLESEVEWLKSSLHIQVTVLVSFFSLIFLSLCCLG